MGSQPCHRSAADSNRSIKRSINGICCILLVAYIVVLMMHGLTNAKLILPHVKHNASALQTLNGSAVLPINSCLLTGRAGVRILVMQDIFLFSNKSGPAVGSTRPPTEWVPGFFTTG